MIYLDSSVALAQIRSEDRRPDAYFWLQPMISSRLLQYEVWNRLHAYQASAYRHGKARQVLQRLVWVEMSGDALVRALAPFPAPVRTLDGLHLATMSYLQARGTEVRLASYDIRLLEAAAQMGFGTIEP